MRHALARLVSRDAAAPSLRERLLGARTRLARATGRSTTIEPASALPSATSAVDRAALVNYATFLHLERERVQGELYPHMSRRSRHFVRSLNQAWAFFHTGPDTVTARPDLAPAASRAVPILDAVGIDWRRDRVPAGALPEGDAHYRDTGERPHLPHRWPVPDAALLEALDDLTRLDAAMEAMHVAGDATRNDRPAPAYDDLQRARDAALTQLARERAESLTGLQVKARALMSRPLSEELSEARDNLTASLAYDLISMKPPGFEPQPDPIHVAIADNQRLNAAWTATNALPDVPGTLDRPPEVLAAQNAFHRHTEDVLLTTRPTTAEGCKALARYAVAFRSRAGFSLDQQDWSENLRILALIARSPLL